MNETPPRIGRTSGQRPHAQPSLRSFLEQVVRDGARQPGQRLPTERALSRQFGVTRTTVRQLLAEMERRGDIYRRVGRGTFVAERPSAREPDDSVWRDVGPKELMEARLTVEPSMVRLFIENASPRDLDRILSCIVRSEASRSFEEFELWDESLHEAIVAGTRNPLLTRWYALITATRRQAGWSGIKRRVYTAAYRREIEAQHRRILDALTVRDECRALAEVEEHLTFIRDGLFGRPARGPSPADPEDIAPTD